MSLPTDASYNLPMRDLLLKHIDRLHELSYNLFSSIVPREGGPRRPSPDSAAFLACDAALSGSLKQARIHQLKNRKIENLKDEIMELELSLRETLETLQTGKHELDDLIDEGDYELKAMRNAKETAIPYADALEYAEHLAPFTSAPPSFPAYREAVAGAIGEAAPPPFNPPYPSVEQLRRGKLNEGPGISIIGESRDIGVPPKSPPPMPAGDAPPHDAPSQGRPERAPTQQAVHPNPAALLGDLFDLDLNPDL